MVPWPIALLTLFYGVIATLAAAMTWKVMLGSAQQLLAWTVVWLVLSGGATCGLPLLRPWGRVMAMWTSILLMLATLAAAGVLVAAGHPGIGLAVTLSTACHYLMIRYLQRPAVKAYFGFRVKGSAWRESTTIKTLM